MNILDSFRYSVFTLSNLLKCQQISRNRMASSVFPGKSKAYFQKSKVYFSKSKLYFFVSLPKSWLLKVIFMNKSDYFNL